MNSVNLTGYLGKEPRLRDDNEVLNFSLAVKTGYGEKEKTLWVDVALWGKRAPKIHPYLGKGSRVAVSGTILEIRSWEKDGQSNYVLVVNANEIEFLDKKKETKGDAYEGPDEPSFD